MKHLSPAQLKVLGSLSRKAHNHLISVGAEQRTYDEWRHAYTAQTCEGIESWRALEQRHYIPLCNACRRILSKAPLKDNTPRNAASALKWTIKDRATHWELPTEYLAAIIADKTSRPWINGTMTLEQMLEGLNTTTLRHILYTIQARGRARTKKDSNRLGIAPPVEIHTSRSTIPPPKLAAWRGDTIIPPKHPHSSDTHSFPPQNPPHSPTSPNRQKTP